MPKNSKELVIQFSNNLKTFNKIIVEMEKNPGNIKDKLSVLKEAQKEIAISTRKYLDALSVDPKIIKAINLLMEDRKVAHHIAVGKHEQRKKQFIQNENVRTPAASRETINNIRQWEQQNPIPKPRSQIYEGTDSEQKQDFKDIANAIKEKFCLDPDSNIKESFSYLANPLLSPAETIKHIRKVFVTLNKNPRTLRLEENAILKKEAINIEDLQKLQILWQGASIIADESNIHYFKRNLIIAAGAVVSSLCGAIAGTMVAACILINAIGALLFFRLPALDAIGTLGTCISAPLAALAAIPMQIYNTVLSDAQATKNAQEAELLDKALKKVVAVFDAVEDMEKKIVKQSNEGPSSSPSNQYV